MLQVVFPENRSWDGIRQAKCLGKKRKGEEARLEKGRQMMIQVRQGLCKPYGSSRSNIDHQRNSALGQNGQTHNPIFLGHWMLATQEEWGPGSLQLRHTLKQPIIRGHLLSAPSCRWADMYSLKNDLGSTSLCLLQSIACTPWISSTFFFSKRSLGILVDLFSWRKLRNVSRISCSCYS